MGASAARRVRADWGGSELPTNHSRPHALGWERGCGDKGKNSRGQLTFDPTDRGCKPLQDKRAGRDSRLTLKTALNSAFWSLEVRLVLEENRDRYRTIHDGRFRELAARL